MTARPPVRVLMILDTFSFGGAENLIVELARYAPQSLDFCAPHAENSRHILCTHNGRRSVLCSPLLNRANFLRHSRPFLASVAVALAATEYSSIPEVHR